VKCRLQAAAQALVAEALSVWRRGAQRIFGFTIHAVGCVIGRHPANLRIASRVLGEMLWLDKYRPHSLSEMKFHSTLNQQLLQLASPEKVQSLPHLLFYGPSGAGKKARVSALLRAVYGPGADKVKVDMRNFKISGGKVVDQGAAADGVELAILSSSFHVEMSPSDVGPFKDRLITQAVVKEMAQSNMPTGAVTFKIVVLNDVDELSRDAQAALRRTMEKYSSTCRFILVSQNPCRVIDPLRSRCIALRVPSPSVEEIQVVLHGVASAEHVELPAALYVTSSRPHFLSPPIFPYSNFPLSERFELPPRVKETSDVQCCV
jgi:replication factor C subunit 3/5